MKTNPREVLLYYNPESSMDKKTLAFAKSMTPHLKTYAFVKNPSTTTSWHMILKSLGMDPKDLLDKSHPDYQNNIRGKEFNSVGWLDVLQNNPHLIKAPIAIKGDKAILCLNPTDIYSL